MLTYEAATNVAAFIYCFALLAMLSKEIWLSVGNSSFELL